jgi:hypothetical protein
MEVSGQRYAPANLPPEEEPPEPIEKRLRGPQEPVWTRWRKEKCVFIAPAGNRVSVFQPVT